MIRVRYFIIVLLISICTSSVYAQRWMKESSLDFGLFGGGSVYKGELVEKFFEPQATHFCFGLLTRYNLNNRLTFKLAATKGKLSGDDRWYSDNTFRNSRNLHFKSVLWDFTGNVEVNLRILDKRTEKGFIPYVFAGFSIFKFNPQAQFFYEPLGPHAARGRNYTSLAGRNEEWVDLQPLGTEGQQTSQKNDLKRYSLTQLSIPFGAGIKAKISKSFTLGFEVGIRKTFTDYIDDVSGTYLEASIIESQYGNMAAAMSDPSVTLHENGSARGDSSKKDWYTIYGLSVTYRIFSNKVKCFRF